MTSKGSRRLSAFSVYSQLTPKPSSEKSPEKNIQDGSASARKTLKQRSEKSPENGIQDGSASARKILKNTSMVVASPLPKKRSLEVDESDRQTPMNGKKKKTNKKFKKRRTPIRNRAEEDDSILSDNDPIADNDTANYETAVNTSQNKNVPCGNEAAEGLFQWMISPVKPSVFFKEKLDSESFYVKRQNPHYYDGVFSSLTFDAIMRENRLDYDKEMDFEAFIDNQRQSITDKSKAGPSFAWKAFKDGYTIRMRNPQVYSKKLWNLCSLLQEYFSCFVGVNMYLTPARTQGFPPHYDDIDAFILQIEGKKKWKLYKPRNENEVLVRYSSGDMTADEIGQPFMEVEMKAGDLLYFPRGIIHQAMTSSEHSLHLTVSCNQLNTWGDLLQIGFTNAIEQAIKENVEFRKSLPKDFMEFAGAIYSDQDSSQRLAFVKKFNHLAGEALKYLSVDQAVDEHAIDFIHGSMPPTLSLDEENCSVHGNGSCVKLSESTGKPMVLVTSDLTLETKVRWIRKRAFRLMLDEEGAKLFYSVSNSKHHKESNACFMEVDDDVVPAIHVLFKSHPDFVKVDDLPIDSSEVKLDFVQQLYDLGFLVTEDKLPYEF